MIDRKKLQFDVDMIENWRDSLSLSVPGGAIKEGS